MINRTGWLRCLRRSGGFALLCLWPAVAWADSSPGIVTLVPATSKLTGQLPVGGSFTFQVPVPSYINEEMAGAVEIWPTDNEASCLQPFQGNDYRQHYKLALQYVSGSKVLQASVPQLQSGQRFCFYVTRQVVISAAKAESLSKTLSESLQHLIEKEPGTAGGQQQSHVHRALAQALRQHHVDVADSRRLEDALVQALSGVLRDYEAALDTNASVAAPIKAATQRLEAARAKLVGTGLTIETQVPIWITRSRAGKFSAVGIREIQSGALDKESVEQIKLQLDAWPETKLKAAIALISKAAAESKDAKRALILKRFKLPPTLAARPLGVLLDGDKKQLVSKDPGTLLVAQGLNVELPLAGDPKLMESVLAQFRAYASYLQAGQQAPTSEPSLAHLLRAVDALQGYIDADHLPTGSAKAMIASREELTTATQALTQAQQTVFLDGNVRASLQESLTPLNAVGATASIPDASNYVAADVGLSVALPTSGGSQEPWLLPYVGLNVYSMAVDRKIAWSEIVGSRVRQRVSLTVGMTLGSASSPNVPGRKITGPILDRYPLLALGFRLTSFIRISGGVLIYRLGDINPASAATTLGVAPFVGLSADVDVISAFMSELSKYSNIKP